MKDNFSTGNDPATDLRGTGMLALAQLLFFLRDQKTKDLARDVYKLSLHPIQVSFKMLTGLSLIFHVNLMN